MFYGQWSPHRSGNISPGRWWMVKAPPYIIELNTGQETIVIAHADYPDNEYQFGKGGAAFNVGFGRRAYSVIHMDDIAAKMGADRFIFGHTR